LTLVKGGGTRRRGRRKIPSQILWFSDLLSVAVKRRGEQDIAQHQCGRDERRRRRRSNFHDKHASGGKRVLGSASSDKKAGKIRVFRIGGGVCRVKSVVPKSVDLLLIIFFLLLLLVMMLSHSERHHRPCHIHTYKSNKFEFLEKSSCTYFY
jgi:hypothetical protein